MTNLAFIKSVAIHESSHAACACMLGLSVAYAEVRFCSRYVGNMGYSPDALKQFADGRLLGSKIQVALAGPLGESMHLDGTGQVNPATFFGNFESLDGDVSCARDLAARLAANLEDRNDLLIRSAISAYGRLLSAWPSVLALGEFLFRHQFANARTINSFFRKQA